MRAQSLILVLAGAAAGFAAGWGWGSSSSAGVDVGNADPAAEIGSDAGGPARSLAAVPGARPSRVGQVLASLPGAEAPAACATWATRADLWRQRAEELAQELSVERALRLQSEGTEPEPPAELAERFREAALRASVQKALKELGGGEVTSIDCTEYPCVVYGETPGERELEKLQDATALDAYSEDHRDVFSWSTGMRKGGGAAYRKFFGIALHPGAKKDTGEIRRRLEYRTREMWEAYRPQAADGGP